VGVVAFQMFTGKLPFDHEEQVPLLMMHIHDPPPKPTDLEPSIPKALEEVILKLLEKKPRDRYPDCRVLTRELQQIAKEVIKV
jgi:serine/threonine-protein kinase